MYKITISNGNITTHNRFKSFKKLLEYVRLWRSTYGETKALFVTKGEY